MSNDKQENVGCGAIALVLVFLVMGFLAGIPAGMKYEDYRQEQKAEELAEKMANNAQEVLTKLRLQQEAQKNRDR